MNHPREKSVSVLVHLPSGLVPLLNALHWSQPEFQEELELFDSTWTEFGRAIDFQSTYFIDHDEERNIEILNTLWNTVKNSLGEELEFGRLAKDTLDTVGLWNELSKLRQQPHHSPIPAINDLLLAGAAYCSGQGQRQAITDRLGFVEQTMINLRASFEVRQEELSPEIRETLNRGFQLVESGLSTLTQESEEPKSEVEKLGRVKEGASLVEVLLEWDQRDHQKLVEDFTDYNIPAVGAEMQLALKTLTSLEKENWEGEIRTLEGRLLPQLLGFWSLVGGQMILPPEQRLELLQDADEAINALQEAVAALRDESLENEQAIALFTEALEWASDAFTAVEDEAVRPEDIKPGIAQDLYQAVLGILGGTVPDAALADLIKTHPQAEPIQQLLDGYLQGELPPDALSEAAYRLTT